MSEQNKIDEIKEALVALTPRPWGWSESVTTCSLGECRRLELWTTENEEMELTIDDYKFAAKSPEYITYLLQEIERKDEALRFYADEDNYEEGQLLQDPECGDWFNDPPKVIFDSGQRAREAL